VVDVGDDGDVSDICSLHVCTGRPRRDGFPY
jgi:hypothetical protein